MCEIFYGISAQPSMVTLSSHFLHPRSCGEHDSKSVLLNIDKRCTIVCNHTNIVIWVPIGLEESGEIWYVDRTSESADKEPHRCTHQ